MNYDNRILPWSVIIALMLFFFPIGIYLAIYKLHNERKNYVYNGRATKNIGKFFIGLGIMYFLIFLLELSGTRDVNGMVQGYFIIIAICIGGGYAILRNGKKYMRLGQEHYDYINIIRNSKDGSIDEISWKKFKSYDATCMDLQEMIDENILEDTYIDKENRVIVSPLIPRQNVVIEKEVNNKAKKQIVIKCPNCGGVNTLTSNHGRCEYCDSPISE